MAPRAFSPLALLCLLKDPRGLEGGSGLGPSSLHHLSHLPHHLFHVGKLGEKVFDLLG